MKILRTLLLVLMIATMLGLTDASASPLAQTPKKYYNAQQKKDVAAWGAKATITWTDPALNGGTFSAHRIAMIQVSPFQFGEIGWEKTTGGLLGFVTYNDGSGIGNQGTTFSVSPATHEYALQYDPNTQRYWFYVDGSIVFNAATNFPSGNRVAGGGEAYDGVESMGHTRLSDLGYSVNQGGNFSYAPWNGYESYQQGYPYCNILIDSSSFYDADCPYYIALPLLLK
jgi:hypothetical protein